MGRKDKSAQKDSELVGSAMRIARQEKGISLTEMAKALVYTKNYLSAIENNKILPSQGLVESYESYLQLSKGRLSSIPLKKVVSSNSSRRPTKDISNEAPAKSNPDIVHITKDIFGGGYWHKAGEMRPVSIIIYEHLALLREYLSSSLKADVAFNLLYDTGELDISISQIGILVPDVFLLGLSYDFHELERIPEIQNSSTRTRIIALGPNIPNIQVIDTIRRYNINYVNQESASHYELQKAIIAVGYDQGYIDETLSFRAAIFTRDRTLRLTQRELRILEQLAHGYSNVIIAENLEIHVATVKTHMRRIFQKLNVSNRMEAIVYALQNKLVTIQNQPDPFP